MSGSDICMVRSIRVCVLERRTSLDPRKYNSAHIRRVDFFLRTPRYFWTDLGWNGLAAGAQALLFLAPGGTVRRRGGAFVMYQLWAVWDAKGSHIPALR